MTENRLSMFVALFRRVQYLASKWPGAVYTRPRGESGNGACAYHKGAVYASIDDVDKKVVGHGCIWGQAARDVPGAWPFFDRHLWDGASLVLSEMLADEFLPDELEAHAAYERLMEWADKVQASQDNGEMWKSAIFIGNDEVYVSRNAVLGTDFSLAEDLRTLERLS